MLKPDCFETGRRQQLTRQLITARVQVIASTLPPHTSATHFTEMCIWLQPWREANVYTVTRSPGRPPASSSSVAALERMRRVASDHRGRGAGWMDAVTRPSQRRGAVALGGLSRGDGASTAVVCRSVIRLQLQLRLVGGRRCVGGPADGSLRNNHGTRLSNENSDNADNPSKVVMPLVTSHAWRQSVCLPPTHSGRQRRSAVT